jgi:hypothetical protein
MTESDTKLPPGTLTLVSTPIGNLADVTLRALDVLREADAVLAEDTRHSRKLFTHHGLPSKQMIAYHDHNKERVTPAIVSRLLAGERLALISDAGTPGVRRRCRGDGGAGGQRAAACSDPERFSHRRVHLRGIPAA